MYNSKEYSWRAFMLGSTANKPQDKTLRWVFLICFLIALIQTVIVREEINATIIGEIIGSTMALFAIAGAIGIIINLFLKNKAGYWAGLLAAIIVDIAMLFTTVQK
jgi:hypothetical protein